MRLCKVFWQFPRKNINFFNKIALFDSFSDFVMRKHLLWYLYCFLLKVFRLFTNENINFYKQITFFGCFSKMFDRKHQFWHVYVRFFDNFRAKTSGFTQKLLFFNNSWTETSIETRIMRFCECFSKIFEQTHQFSHINCDFWQFFDSFSANTSI